MYGLPSKGRMPRALASLANIIAARGENSYVIADETLGTRVKSAIAHWQAHTPFRFSVRTNQPDYISFEQLDGCWSRVGRQGGKQWHRWELGCGLGAAIHEIGHAIGLWHEQSRSDRDNFIEIIWDNIEEQRKPISTSTYRMARIWALTTMPRSCTTPRPRSARTGKLRSGQGRSSPLGRGMA